MLHIFAVKDMACKYLLYCHMPADQETETRLSNGSPPKKFQYVL